MPSTSPSPGLGQVDQDDGYYDWTECPHILLYIDNSNIFESAKKHSGHKKGYINGIQDVACRIDVGKLIHRAVGNRGVLFGKLYGSEPPALDSVWEAIRRKKVHVETFERSKWTLKEKETDVSLATGAVRDIIEQRDIAGPKRTVILFSGDRDLLAVVNVAIDYGYKVEIWSFDSAVNSTVKRHATNKPDKLKVYSIDKIFDEITFTKYVWGNQPTPRERSLITSITLPPAQDKMQFLREFVAKAGDTFKLPMFGKYLQNYKYIVLVPCIKEHYEPKTGDQQNTSIRTYDYYLHIQPFTHQMDEYYKKLGIVVELQAWNEFLSSRRPSNVDGLTFGNRFENLDLEENESEDEEEEEFFDCIEFFDTHQEDASSPTDDLDLDDIHGGFVPYVRKATKPTRMYSSSCIHKFWCTTIKCPYKHSREEREYFQVQPEAHRRRFYKVKACFHLVCRYQDKPYKCGYAHNLGESRCLCCNQLGNGKHWMDQCPKKTAAWGK